MKISVLGTKDFTDYQLLEKELVKEKADVFVVGGKRGPDELAQEYALENDIPTQVFLPDYQKYGRSANYYRNLQMIEHSSKVIIFWNGRSRSHYNYLPHIRKWKRLFRTVIY
ncbi:MAG: SLOG family protein [Bacteroidota bacterium]